MICCSLKITNFCTKIREFCTIYRAFCSVFCCFSRVFALFLPYLLCKLSNVKNAFYFIRIDALLISDKIKPIIRIEETLTDTFLFFNSLRSYRPPINAVCA